jgi:hypothetical protein
MVINIDADPTNADWTKQTWDLGVDNVADLRKLLKQQGTTVAHFKTLPVYQRNVKKLPWLRGL